MAGDDPVPGEWDGPIHGERGRLADDGERAQCHVCGRFYGNLGCHIRVAHRLAPDEYRAIFGLRQGTGLVGPRLAALRAERAGSPTGWRSWPSR